MDDHLTINAGSKVSLGVIITFSWRERRKVNN